MLTPGACNNQSLEKQLPQYAALKLETYPRNADIVMDVFFQQTDRHSEAPHVQSPIILVLLAMLVSVLYFASADVLPVGGEHCAIAFLKALVHGPARVLIGVAIDVPEQLQTHTKAVSFAFKYDSSSMLLNTNGAALMARTQTCFLH